LQRCKKIPYHDRPSSSTELEPYAKGTGIIYQCPKCNKIMCVSDLGVQGATRNDGHHDHMDRCGSKLFIMRFKDYFALSGYGNEEMPFWLWKR
jgi:hypothetical protein